MKKMKNIQYFIGALIFSIGIFTSCDVLEPEGEDVYDMDIIKANVAYAEGFLCNAYRNLASTHTNFTLSYGSDDAVTNQLSSNIKTAVSGGWTSNSNPFSQWNTCYESIMYINTFMEIMDDVVWDEKYPLMDSLYRVKLKGEAYGLRAWNYFLLLQAHAGKSEDGSLMGVPIIDHVLDQNNPDDFEVERSSFADLVDFIIADCDSAIQMLPRRWVEQEDAFENIVVGVRNNNRINGQVAMFIKAKTLLYAASPAYSEGAAYTYQMAAETAGLMMLLSGGLSSVNASNTDHLSFYSNPDVTNSDNEHPEVIWYGAKNEDLSSWESTNYPPSLYGEGRTNPSQNLVDAFPMLDGTPVSLAKLYSNDPYSGRDPRLDLYIMRHGSVIPGVYGDIVITTNEGTQDAVGSTDEYATQTGYYIRKFMNTRNVDLDPEKVIEGMHYYVHVRYTDVLLMFAEAANEAVGPDVAIATFTARQVINAIRDRAGITSTDYVNGLDQAGMRELIRNERRIELCFEKQRFWDLRRWNDLDKLNEDVKGVRVSADGMVYSYEVVEERTFQDHNIYGPIPYSETLKYEITQNAGY
jgi:hypothetical protein